MILILLLSYSIFIYEIVIWLEIDSSNSDNNLFIIFILPFILLIMSSNMIKILEGCNKGKEDNQVVLNKYIKWALDDGSEDH